MERKNDISKCMHNDCSVDLLKLLPSISQIENEISSPNPKSQISTEVNFPFTIWKLQAHPVKESQLI